MAFILWDEKYSVGNREIDEQHKTLFKLVNDIDDAISKGREKKIVNSSVETLIEYTIIHFSDEEKLFLNSEYPKKEEHKTEHMELKENVDRISTDLKQGMEIDMVDVLNFLKRWLIKHIMDSDRGYMDFIR